MLPCTCTRNQHYCYFFEVGGVMMDNKIEKPDKEAVESALEPIGADEEAPEIYKVLGDKPY